MFMTLNGYWIPPSQARRLKGRRFRFKFLHLVLSVRPLQESRIGDSKVMLNYVLVMFLVRN